MSGKGDKHASRINAAAWFDAPYWDRPRMWEVFAASSVEKVKATGEFPDWITEDPQSIGQNSIHTDVKPRQEQSKMYLQSAYNSCPVGNDSQEKRTNRA